MVGCSINDAPGLFQGPQTDARISLQQLYGRIALATGISSAFALPSLFILPPLHAPLDQADQRRKHCTLVAALDAQRSEHEQCIIGWQLLY